MVWYNHRNNRKGESYKKLTLTIDDEAYEAVGELPRKVSISKITSWLLRAIAEDIKPGGMTEDEFIKYMDNDPEGKVVREYLGEKLGPILRKVSKKK